MNEEFDKRDMEGGIRRMTKIIERIYDEQRDMIEMIFPKNGVRTYTVHSPKSKNSAHFLENMRAEGGSTAMGVSFSCYLWGLICNQRN